MKYSKYFVTSTKKIIYTKESKEKIDVVTWNPNLGLFVSELLRPGKVLGMNIDSEKKEILVVTDEDSLNLAIGFKGTNVVLARKITGYQIRVIDETKANEEGVEFKRLDEYVEEAKEEERKRFREKQQEAIKSRIETAHEEEPTEELFVKEGDDEEEVEVTPVETVEEEKVEEPVEAKVEEKVEISEEIQPEEPVVETKKVKEEEPVEFKEVKTTTTLESLEKLLEDEKKEKSSSKKSFKKKKKEVKKDNEDDEEKEEKKVIQKMDIYTDEELEAFENEDSDEDFEDEEDYSEYDDDDYYEDR